MATPSKEQQEERQWLKATFFVNRMQHMGVVTLHKRVQKYVEKLDHNLDWNFAKNNGVDEDIANAIVQSGQKLSMYYCHPSIVSARPEFLQYYRCMSVYSQKSLKAVSGVSAVDKIENGSACSSKQAQQIAIALNRSASLVYGTIEAIDTPNTTAILFATIGTTIEGSWRNAIGQEGERVIRAILTIDLLSREELVLINTRDSREIEAGELNNLWVEQNAMSIQSLQCTNGSHVIFASEPDIKCVLKNGKTSAGIEVKAGLDPAAALERLGAMQKSFEQIHKEEPSAETILIASCITDEVQRRLNTNASVTRVLSLTDIVSGKKGERNAFCNSMRAYLDLVEKKF